MKIVIATKNTDKLQEIKSIWKDIHGIEIDWMGNYPELGDVEESGETLNENAALKAEYVSQKLDCWAVADDTGLFVKYLDGRPGVYSSRFAGENATYDDNVDKILEEMRDVPRQDREAEFHCVVCLSRNDTPAVFAEGIVQGYITEERRGQYGFGYDPVFEIKGSEKTFAQLTADEKNALSHRYLAFKKMGEIIKDLIRK